MGPQTPRYLNVLVQQVEILLSYRSFSLFLQYLYSVLCAVSNPRVGISLSNRCKLHMHNCIHENIEQFLGNIGNVEVISQHVDYRMDHHGKTEALVEEPE